MPKVKGHRFLLEQLFSSEKETGKESGPKFVMRKNYALLGSALLLGIIIIGVSLVGYVLTPVRGAPSTKVIVPITTFASSNETSLILTLKLPNGTDFTSGRASVGPYNSSVVNGSYYFRGVTAGSYSLNYTGAPNFLVPPLTMILKNGVANLVNETIYPLRSFTLIETSGLSYNGTLPGPGITVKNDTAVRVKIFNNTTQIVDFAVVLNLANATQSNVLFNSLSNNLSAGGSTNDTFIVNSTGSFYYTSLIGSQSKDGEYGDFTVTP
jgi:hypothetical protein